MGEGEGRRGRDIPISSFKFQDFRRGGGDGGVGAFLRKVFQDSSFKMGVGWGGGRERRRKVIVLIVATDLRLWFKFQVSNLKARNFTPVMRPHSESLCPTFDMKAYPASSDESLVLDWLRS